jgi:hypothetical protein
MRRGDVWVHGIVVGKHTKEYRNRSETLEFTLLSEVFDSGTDFVSSALFLGFSNDAFHQTLIPQRHVVFLSL